MLIRGTEASHLGWWEASEVVVWESVWQIHTAPYKQSTDHSSSSARPGPQVRRPEAELDGSRFEERSDNVAFTLR